MHTLDKLKIYLRELAPKGIALAFSGGVDSSLLLAVLKMLHAEAPFPLQALTMHSIFHREEELEQVKAFTAQAGVPLKLFACDRSISPPTPYSNNK